MTVGCKKLPNLAKKQNPQKKQSRKPRKSVDIPGISFAKVAARIQQMMEPQSTVTHNEWVQDRTGNKVLRIVPIANRVILKKRKRVNHSGAGFYDWHTGKIQIQPQGELVNCPTNSDITKWDDFEGVIPDLDESEGFF